jgi:uncharacterized protein YigA (DUF484 family)
MLTVELVYDGIIKSMTEDLSFPEFFEEHMDLVEEVLTIVETNRTPWLLPEILREKIEENSVVKEKLLAFAQEVINN